MLYNNSILYFWDYAVLGLKTFSNKISYISLFSNNSIIIVELSILIPLFWIFFFIYYFKGKDKNYLLLLIFSLSTFILSFPISDSIHFLYGSIVSLIGVMYFINNLFCNRFKSNVKIKKFLLQFFSINTYEVSRLDSGIFVFFCSETIKELEGHLLYYYINENKSKIKSILQQILSLNETIYKRDQEIIDYWEYIDDHMPLYPRIAPDGLPTTSDHAFVVLGYKLNNDGSLKPEAPA